MIEGVIPLQHNGQISSTRSTKPCLPLISTDDSMGNHYSDEQRKTKGSIKHEKFMKEQDGKKRSEPKEDFDHQRSQVKIKGFISFSLLFSSISLQ